MKRDKLWKILSCKFCFLSLIIIFREIQQKNNINKLDKLLLHFYITRQNKKKNKKNTFFEAIKKDPVKNMAT